MSKRICVFGVNGVGKSSVLAVVSANLPDVTVLHGSSLLKEALGVASYKELETRSAKEKKLAYLSGLEEALAAVAHGTVIVDTHLLVAINGVGSRKTEDMWHDRLLDCFDGFAYITAPTHLVSARRHGDLLAKARFRQADEASCRYDLADNDARWDAVSPLCKQACVIVNGAGLDDAARKLLRFIQIIEQ